LRGCSGRPATAARDPIRADADGGSPDRFSDFYDAMRNGRVSRRCAPPGRHVTRT